MKLYRIVNFLFLFNFLALFSQSEYANLLSFVTDDAQIFTKSEKEILESKLYNFETETSNQIVILTINSLNGISIEQYAVEVFNTNKLGQEHLDNGILILYAKQDRKVRLEIGYGLEPIITDALSKRIIEKTMIPAFKKGNNFNGIDSATNQLIKFITDPKLGEEFVKEKESKMHWFFYLFATLFLGVFIFVGGLFFLKSYKRLIEVFRGFITGQISFFYFLILLIGSLFSTFISSIFIFIPLTFSSMIFEPINFKSDGELIKVIIFILFFILIIIPLLIALYKVFFTKSEPFKINWLQSNSKYIKKTFSSSGSSSSFGSSSSGSSFSGGGGSSGGGGASGSW